MNKMLMKRYGSSKRNLFILMMNTYNNEKPYYEILPLRDSDVKRAVIFCGKLKKIEYPQNMLGHACIYLETNEAINENNYFKNVQRLLNLIWLATGLPIEYFTEEMEEYDSFESIYNDYRCDTFYNPNIVHGLVIDKNPIARVASYRLLIQKLKVEAFEKFDNALNTHTWAQEIERLPNPHLKYTLYMTLYLSSIEQLVGNTQKQSKTSGVCEKCREIIQGTNKTSLGKKREELIKELLSGKNIESIIKWIRLLYGKLRSGFLHHGKLHGDEKEGGFMFGKSSRNKLLEDMVNLKMLNRKLLELFLQKRQTT